mmetsp:Transcript_12325/g.25042  ORF Transcript_12325/g.25042 Transcript_12325/m.25042 type:complete len:349 (-) Transcript_12325:1528-2574(-)
MPRRRISISTVLPTILFIAYFLHLDKKILRDVAFDQASTSSSSSTKSTAPHTPLPLRPNTKTNINATTPKSKLADDCHHIYLDLGSNIGIHSRLLYQPHLYPHALKSKFLFDQQFGPHRHNNDLCVFAFEPNPIHRERHVNLTRYFGQLGWRYHYLPFAVSDSYGNGTFYHNGDGHKEEIGFGDHRLIGKGAVEEVVPTIRLVDWIREEVRGRRLPKKVFGKYGGIYGGGDGKPKVVMKMDIESMEYRVLPDLMFSGVLCQEVDFIYGEFHDWPVDYEPHGGRSRGNAGGIGNRIRGELHLKKGEVMNFQRELIKAFDSVNDCRTREFFYFDDETYAHDGVPLIFLDT